MPFELEARPLLGLDIRVWLRLEYQIRLGWRKETGLVGEDVVGPEVMGRLFSSARGATQAGGENGGDVVLEQWLAAHKHTEDRIRATVEARVRSPLIDIIRTFKLTQRQWATLVFALMPEVDPNLVQGYRYLARDPNCRSLDGRLLAQLVYDTPQTRSMMARDLSATSPLIRYRLLDMSSGTPADPDK